MPGHVDKSTVFQSVHLGRSTDCRTVWTSDIRHKFQTGGIALALPNVEHPKKFEIGEGAIKISARALACVPCVGVTMTGGPLSWAGGGWFVVVSLEAQFRKCMHGSGASFFYPALFDVYPRLSGCELRLLSGVFTDGHVRVAFGCHQSAVSKNRS